MRKGGQQITSIERTVDGLGRVKVRFGIHPDADDGNMTECHGAEIWKNEAKVSSITWRELLEMQARLNDLIADCEEFMKGCNALGVCIEGKDSK